jgi:hypothetical protein
MADGPVAPLPAGYSQSGEKPLRGLYAEVQGLSSIFDDQELEALDLACRDQGKTVTIEGADLRGAGATRIYRTADKVAVIEDRSRLSIDTAACVARFELDRSVEIETGGFSYSKVSGFSNPDLPCGDYRSRRRCREETIAGLAVTCIDEGDGLVGSFRCVSRRRDLSRGLLVAFGTYIDDGSAPTGSWQLDRIDLDAAIDPVVFRKAKD